MINLAPQNLVVGDIIWAQSGEVLSPRRPVMVLSLGDDNNKYKVIPCSTRRPSNENHICIGENSSFKKQMILMCEFVLELSEEDFEGSVLFHLSDDIINLVKEKVK